MSEDFLNRVVGEKLYPNKRCLQHYLRSVYDGIDFDGKTFLDIGGGVGLHSFYAVSRGAEKALCLEPEGDGSSRQVNGRFNRLRNNFGLRNVFMEHETFQLYQFKENYDIILLHNSINHLDENACMNLLKDMHAVESYRTLFGKIASIAAKEAVLVICDCSNSNFFARLNMPNPFARAIEWEKHQKPEVWSSLLTEAGFANPQIRWLSFNTFGSVGRILLGNKYAAYFLHSHFCLKMTRAAAVAGGKSAARFPAPKE